MLRESLVADVNIRLAYRIIVELLIGRCAPCWPPVSSFRQIPASRKSCGSSGACWWNGSGSLCNASSVRWLCWVQGNVKLKLLLREIRWCKGTQFNPRAILQGVWQVRTTRDGELRWI